MAQSVTQRPPLAPSSSILNTPTACVPLCANGTPYLMVWSRDDRVCTVGSVGAGQTTFLVLRGRCGSSIGPDPLADGVRELVCPGTQILKESVCMCARAGSTHAPACGCNESVRPLNIAPHSPFVVGHTHHIRCDPPVVSGFVKLLLYSLPHQPPTP